MKTVRANLLADVVSIYDQNKTTIQGRVLSKIVDGAEVLGPPLNRFVDVLADTAGTVIPVLSYMSPNGRLFHITAEAGGIASISCHTVNLTNGAVSYNGIIRMNLADLAATTHTYRGFKVLDDGGPTGWRIFLATSGSVAINGGLYCVNNVDLADFTPVGPGPLFPFATGLNQKATYFLQDPAAIGVGQLNIASTGVTLDRPNNRVYVHNGVSATHQFYVYSTNAALNCPLSAATIDAGTDRFTIASHGFADNTPIFITNLSGAAGLTNNTTYFVRNPTANDFQVSATSGGAAINITTAGTADVCRAFGTTGSAWVRKTGNLPALTGTLIQADSEDYAVPGHTSNSGQPCVFFCTTSNLYLGRLSELTPGATSWPSLVTSNILGTVNQITSPTVTIATWSNVLDRAVYLTNNNILIMKPVVNNQIDRIFAGINNKFRENTVSDVVELGFVTAAALDIEDGWCVLTGATGVTGQRGTILADLRSDSLFDHSYIITKVLDTPSSVYKFLTTTDKLFDVTGSLKIQYRTSGFGSISGGWTNIPFAEDLTLFATGTQVQFKILFDTLSLDTCIPAQLQEFFLGLESNFEISDNWEFSRDLSSNLSPSRVAFRLKKAYSTSVPQLFFRAYDLSDALLVNHNTVANIANFQYSTDNGLTWLPLGTVPNVVGTLIRYTFSSPPGVDIRPSLKED
jgi:hypothetical protein